MSAARALSRWAGCALAGAAAVLSFAPFGLWWLAPLCLAVLFRVSAGVSGAGAAGLCGFAFGLGLFGAGVWWIFLCLHKYAGFSFAAALGLSVVFVFVLSLFPAAAATVGRIVPAGGVFARLAALAAAWTLMEWIRGFAFTGFPFLSLGYSQIPASPLAGFAPVGGVYAAGFAAALIAAALAFLSRPLSSGASSSVTGLILLMLLSGATSGRAEWTHKTGTLPVSLLQGNVAQDRKWGAEDIQNALSDYLALASESDAGGDFSESGRLIILPETALPLLLRDIPEDYLRDLGRTAGAGGGVLAGMFYEDESGGLQNAAVGLGGVGGDFERMIYGKRHLVPYGEYLPFASVLGPFLRANEIPYSSLTPGTFAGPMRFPFGGVGLSICYEDAFGDEWRGQWSESGLLVNMTNDAWYDDSAMLSQHRQMSQARALESGRWLARATNTGDTVLLDHRGRIAGEIAPGIRGFLTMEAELRTGETPYGRHGDVPVVLAIFLVLFLCAGSSRMKFARRRKDD